MANDIVPKSARVFKAHAPHAAANAASTAVPAKADVYVVDDVEPPLFTRHLLLVIIDDAPMTELFNAKNKIPTVPPGSPPSPESALMPSMPTLSALAANGLRMRSFRGNVECSPTRATTLTGVYAFRHGIANVVNLNPNQQSAEFGEFGDPGYVWPTLFNRLEAITETPMRTAFFGKIHLSGDYNQISPVDGRTGAGWQILNKVVGFNTRCCATLRNFNQSAGDHQPDEADGSYYNFPLNGAADAGTSGRVNTEEQLITGVYATTKLVDEAIIWWNAADNESRSFMWLAFNATHTPFGGNQPVDPDRDFPPHDLVNTQEYIDMKSNTSLQAVHNDQQAAMEAVDTELGRLLASMPPAVRAVTTVVVMGDNGHDAICLPSAINEFDKDFGDDWNFTILNNRMKGTLYHYGSGFEFLWSGPGLGGSLMPRRGEVVDFPVDAPDVPETICNYFGTTMTPTDGVSFYDAIYVNPTITYETHPRRDQYSETFNPNGDWRNRLATANDTTIQLQQGMWSWFLPTDAVQFSAHGRFHLIRKRGQGGVADNTWHYELYKQYDENYADVDPHERTNVYDVYPDIATEIEARIEALLNSSLGDGDGLPITQEDGTSIKVVPTENVDGMEKVPILQEDGFTLKYIDPATLLGLVGMPVDNSDTGSGDKIVPYVGIDDEVSNWALTIDNADIGPGAVTKIIPLNQSDALVIEGSDTGSGDKVIASIPGTPNTILIENSDDGSGDKVLNLVEIN